MTIRTNRLMGKIWGDSPTLVVNFNGTEVFSGPVTGSTEAFRGSVSDWQSFIALCEWSTDSTVTGSIPVSIAVSGGDLLLQTIVMNQIRPSVDISLVQGAPWPGHVPESINQLITEMTTLSESELQSKYGAGGAELDNLTSNSMYVTQTETISIENNFITPFRSTNNNDAKQNVRINGTSKNKNASSFPNAKGIWCWSIKDGETLEFDYQINTN